MWLLAVLLLADTSRAFSIALAPAESVSVTVGGAGDPVVLIPGLFGSAFGYRSVLPRLVDAGYRTIVIEPFGGERLVRAKVRRGLIAASGDTTWVTDRVVDGYTAGAARDLDGTLKAYLAMAQAREGERLAPHLGEIRCPVRLVVGTLGRGSGVSPAEVATLAGLLRSFAVDTVPGAGHFIYEEQPAAVVAAVQRLHSGVAALLARPAAP